MVSQNLSRFNKNDNKRNQKKSSDKVSIYKSENDRYQNNPLLNKLDLDKNKFEPTSDHQSLINPKISNFSNSRSGQKRIKSEEIYGYGDHQGQEYVNLESTLKSKIEYSYTQNSEKRLVIRNHAYSDWIYDLDLTSDYLNPSLVNLNPPNMIKEDSLILFHDENNNLISSIEKIYNLESSDWVNVSQSLYTYDGSDNLLNLLQQNWDGSDWVNASQSLYTYDGSDNLLNLLQQNWDPIYFDSAGDLEQIGECTDTEYIVTVGGGTYPLEVSWEIVNTGLEVVASGGAPIAVADGVTACLADGSYGILMYDSYGDGWTGNILQLWTLDADGNPVEQLSGTIETGAYAAAQFNVGEGPSVDILGGLGGFVDASEYIYTYDENDNLLTASVDYVNVDIDDSYDIVSSLFLYTYDDGNLINRTQQTEFGYDYWITNSTHYSWYSYPFQEGCTDPIATNFDSDAAINDGSCLGYAENGDFALNHFYSDAHIKTEQGIANPTDAMTIMGWFYLNSEYVPLINDRNLVSKSNGWITSFKFHIDDARLRFDIGTGLNQDQSFHSILSQNLVTTGWNHYAATFDGQNIKLFINGVQDPSFLNLDVSESILSAENESIYFGTSPSNNPDVSWIPSELGINEDGLLDGAGEPLWGSHDDISFWDIALDESEIIESINNSLAGSEEGLIGYWKFNEGDGDIIYDHSGNRRHGTVFNTSYELQAPLDDVLGCTDPYADNFNIYANIENGTCAGYPENGFYGLDFINNESSVDLGNNINPSEGLTVAGWFNLSENVLPLSGQRTFVTKVSAEDTKYFLLGSYQNKLSWIVNTGEGSDIELDYLNGNLILSESNLPGGWTHIAATFDGQTMKTYINGSMDSNVVTLDAPATLLQDSSAGTYFGDPIGGGGFLNGVVDDVSIWNNALSEDAIFDLMQSAPEGVLEGLIANYRFNSGDGVLAFDHSGNSNHGNIAGAQWSEMDLLGCMDPLAENYNPQANINDGSCEGYLDAGDYALFFDGQDDYIEIENSEDIHSETISVGAWIKLDNNTFEEDITVMGKFDNEQGKSWKLSISSSAIGFCNPYFTFRDAGGGNKTVSSTEFFTPGVWYHLVGTFDGTNQNIYINGELSAVQNQSNYSINESEANILIGANNQGTLTFMNGAIDESFLFDHALDENEVSELYQIKLNGAESGLLGYWSFDAASSEILFDRSGNMRHGLINGAVWMERENFGCTDMLAGNFNSDANIDDGSCGEYTDNGHFLVEFNNPESYIEIQGDSDFVFQDESFSISTWVKVPDIHESDIACLLNAKDYGFMLYAGGNTSNGQFMVRLDDLNGNDLVQGSFSSNIDLRDNAWHYLTLTKNGNLAKIYVDAILEDSVIINHSMYSGALSLITIGNDITADSLVYFSGLIDEFEVWSSGLSSEQIEINYNESPEADSDDLIAYWKMNFGEGDLVLDHSGGLNHGLLYGAEWSQEILGCLDPYAGNFNPYANLEDGSCSDFPSMGEYSLSFNGLTDRIDLEQDMVSGNFATLSAWFWATDNPTYTSNSGRPIYAQGATETQFADFALGVIASTNSLILEMGQPYILADDIALETWNHVTVSFDSGMISTFINGQLKSEVESENVTINSDSVGAFIGRRWSLDRADNNRFTWDGYLDDIAIWDTVLSVDNLENLYKQSSQLNSAQNKFNLEGYWRFNAGDGDLLFDQSGKTHHSSINGTEWSLENVLHIDQIIGASLDEDSEVKLDLSVFSFSEDSISYTVSSDTLFVLTDLCCGSSGSDSLLISASDNWYGNTLITINAATQSLSNEEVFSLNVIPVNDSPEIYHESDTLEVFEDDSLNIYMIISDLDDELLVLTAISDTNSISLFISDDTVLTVIPDTNWNGLFSLNGFVTDSSGLSDTTVIIVNVLPVNDAPEISSIPDTSLNEDESLSIGISGSDIDEDNLSFDVGEVDSFEMYVFSDGDSLLIVPESDWFGSVEVTVFVSDQDGAQDSTSFNLTVNAVDDEPFVDGYLEDIYLYEDFDEALTINLDEVFTDIDGELNYLVQVLDSGIVNASIDSNHLIFEPLLNSNGVADIVVTAINPVRSFVKDTVQITIFGVNDAPTINELSSIAMHEDIPFQWLSIVDMDSLNLFEDIDTPLGEMIVAVSIENAPVSVTWNGDVNSGPILISNEENYNGSEGLITVCIQDDQYEDCVSTILEVNPVNDSPSFSGEMENTVGLDLEMSTPISINDIDSENLTVTFADSFHPDWLSINNNILEGTPDTLGQFSFLLNVSDEGDSSVTDTFRLSVESFNPVITDIYDIPNDQGGHVYVLFNGSYFDIQDTPNQVYGVMRYDQINEDSSAWVAVMSFPAIGESQYIFDVSTLADSTIEDNAMTQFKIVASMSGGTFHSAPLFGYSIDNIAPTPPTGLMASIIDEGIQVLWNHHSDEDFEYFILEKTIDPSFSIGDIEEQILSDTFYIDTDYLTNQTNFYRISAVDYVGNRGEPSGFVEATILSVDSDLIPEVFALHQNYPNPFNPLTQIRYDLPEDSDVSITIFNLMGRNIKTLLKKKEAAGFRSISWDATNQNGEPVSAGMYIYLIQANTFRETKKMILLK